MTLKECEKKIAELNEKISGLLKEREAALKEWNIAFDAENTEKVTCETICTAGNYELFLVDGESRLCVCDIYEPEFAKEIHEFYNIIERSIQIHNLVNRREGDLMDWQKNLIYVKAMELREQHV